MLKRILAALLCGFMLTYCLTPLSALAVDTPETLLNGAKLNPMKTNYQPLDDLVEQTFAKILQPGMSTYEKTKACFDYLSHDSTYANNPITDKLYYSLWQTVRYQSNLDENVVCEAFGMLTNKTGMCNHFASGFMVLARAIGLESYIATCLATGSVAGTKDHYFVVIRLQGTLYVFDARMGLLSNNSGRDSTRYFCTDISAMEKCYPCDFEECVVEFGGFKTVETKPSFHPPVTEGTTKGNRHFNFGSYPQTRVEDKTLIKNLNAATKNKSFTSFKYSSGKGMIGTQACWDYMWYTDISYGGERYRGVKFSHFRPYYTYLASDRAFSFVDDNGYDGKDTVYWFRFDPIEWHLLDGDNLFITDFAIDAQPFQTAEYYNKNGKTYNGIVCHYFGDKANTYPANDWEHSFLRKWLNEDFYNTAFSEAEKELIKATSIDNTGYIDRYSGKDTIDKVWLLSFYEVKSSGYIFSTDASSRDLTATDYAMAQGICTWETDDHSLLVPWRLRSPGFHSDDTCYITPQRALHYHLDTMGTMAGIRPALRISDPQKLADIGPTKLAYLYAQATASNEISLRCSVINSASEYRFYRYSADGKTLEETYTSDHPTLKISNLTTGKTYVFRGSAMITINGKHTQTALTAPVSVVCQSFLSTPTTPSASSPSTGVIQLKWDPVAGADHYNIYKYVDKVNTEYFTQSKTPSLTINNLTDGYVYYYTVTAVSPDGYESKASTAAGTLCISYPDKPQNVSGEPTASGEITLKWDPVENAQYYKVLHYTSQTTTALLGTTSETSFTVKNLSNGAKYYFVVVAVTDNGKSTSAFSKITIVECKALPSSHTSPIQQTVMRGDVDGDWVITASDARLALRCSVNLEKYAARSAQYLAADVDGNSQVTSADARMILRASVGLENYFGVVAIP